jgi:hypothetical protein
VSDAEQLLEHAFTVFTEASSADRVKKAKTIRALAKRVFSARIRFLKASVAAATDPTTAKVLKEHALQIAKLEDTLTVVTHGGVEAIVREFAGAFAQDILAMV